MVNTKPVELIANNPPSRNVLSTLRRFARARAPVERCELCSLALPATHQHLIEPASRQLLCACDACAILFCGGSQTKYRRVPRRIESWPDFQITDMQWESLGIPINLAFFFQNSPNDQLLAIYPSPAGATESGLAREPWQMLVNENPALSELQPDVEALLVNRVNGARDYFRTPIDECYKLVGVIKTRWRGLSGGREVWEQIAAFFDDLKARSVKPRKHA